MRTLPEFLYTPDIYHSQNYVVLDFETTSLDYGSAINNLNNLVLACWLQVRGNERRYKHSWGGEYSHPDLLGDIASADFLVAQNAKFELQWLKRMGVNLRRVLPADTFLAQWVLDGNLMLPRDLDSLAAKYDAPPKHQQVADMIAAGVDVRDVPKEWLKQYCYGDVTTTHEVFLRQLEELERRDMMHIWHTRNLTCAVISDMEFTGMTLDKDRVREEYVTQMARREQLKRELDELCGGINLASPKQLAVLLYDTLGFAEITDRRGNPVRTATARPSTSKDVIAKLKAKTKKQQEFVAKFQEYRKADTLLTKNLAFFQGVCEEYGGRFTAQFNQGRTATHRLSSSGRKMFFRGLDDERGVQFQNLPRQYKKLFEASGPGRLLGEADSSQLEFRHAVEICDDEQGYADIVNKVDIHENTSIALTAAGEPTDRQNAKASTFKPLYGGQYGTKAQMEYVKFFNLRYSTIAATQRGWERTAVAKGTVRTPLGMEYHWPRARWDRDGISNVKTEVYNYPVQGGATAEVIPIALVTFWYLTEDTEIDLLNTVHDSIVAEFPEERTEEFKEIANYALTEGVFTYLKKVYRYECKVPLATEIKISTHWGDTDEKLKYELFPNQGVTNVS